MYIMRYNKAVIKVSTPTDKEGNTMTKYMVIRGNTNWLIVASNRSVHTVVGKADSREEAIKKMEQIKAEAKQAAEMKKEIKAKAKEMADEIKKSGGLMKYGKTPSGKHYVFYGNDGMTKRSRYCYTLRVDGETVFTSGEIETVIHYILTH